MPAIQPEQQPDTQQGSPKSTPNVQHSLDGEVDVLNATFDRRLEIRKALHGLQQDIKKTKDSPIQVTAEVKIRVPGPPDDKEHVILSPSQTAPLTSRNSLKSKVLPQSRATSYHRAVQRLSTHQHLGAPTVNTLAQRLRRMQESHQNVRPSEPAQTVAMALNL